MSSQSRSKAVSYPASIEHEGTEYAYLVIHSRRRSLSLEVDRHLQIKVRAPLQLERDFIQQWMQSKAYWIAKKFEEISNRYPAQAQLEYKDGALHWFLGKQYQLKLLMGQRGQGLLDQNHILLPCPSDHSDLVEKRLTEWYRTQAWQQFTTRVDACWPAFAQRGHQRPQLRIRRMKSLWGSLSARPIMTLNLKLIKTPERLIDYVVVHELCHLEHRNHGPNFKRLMDFMQPDWRQRKAELNANWI